MTTEAPAPPDRIKSECTECPPWVERCVHFNGHWLTLHRDNVPSENWSVCGDSGPQTLSASGNVHEHPRELWRVGLPKSIAIRLFEEAAAQLAGDA